MVRHLRSILLLACALVLGAAGPVRGDVGTIRYDTGIATGPASTGSALVPDLSFGNRFDAGVGLNAVSESVLTTGSVSRVTFYLAGFEPPFVFLTVFGPVSGSAATPLLTQNLTGAALGWNTHTFATPVQFTGGSFLVGVWTRNTGTGAATDDAVALDSGTRLGQGHHGFAIVDVAGTGFQPLAANAMIRATGDFLPPELILDAQVSASLEDTLLVDADASSTISPGDTLRYTATVANDGSQDAPIARFEAALDPGAPVVAGSVSTSQGSVERGNAVGDRFVEVALGALAAGGSATVRYDVAVPDPFPGGSGQLRAQGVVTGQGFHELASDDPDAPGAADPTLTQVLEHTLPFGSEASVEPRVKLVFDGVGRDSVKLKVKRWVLPPDFTAAGQPLTVDVGGITMTATLDARGRYRAVNDKFKLKQRRRDGSFKLRVKRRSGDWADVCADEGLDAGDNAAKPVTVTVRVTADGTVYEHAVDLEYSSKAGRRGKTRPAR